MTDPQHCTICGRLLDNPAYSLSVDNGGDCLACMATIEEDSEATHSFERVFNLHPNRASKDYKLVQMARASGKLVDTTGMTADEFGKALLGLYRRDQS